MKNQAKRNKAAGGPRGTLTLCCVLNKRCPIKQRLVISIAAKKVAIKGVASK
jgi:hypothetical protein